MVRHRGRQAQPGGRRPRRGPRPRRPRPGPPIRRRGDAVVPGASLARARPPRRGRVRAPGHRGQAGAAGRERRRSRSGRARCGPPSAPVTCCSRSARPTTRSCSPRRHAARRRLGGDDDLDRCRAAGRRPGAADHVLWIDDARPATCRARRAARAAVPRAVGADPRVLRAPGAAHDRRGGVRAGHGLRHLLRRGSARRRCDRSGCSRLASVRTARGSRPWSTRRSSARSHPGDLVLVHAGVGHRAASRRRTVPEGTDFLYPFIEADERDAGRAPGRPRALGGGEGRGRARACGRPRSTGPRPTVDAAATAMAARVRAGRAAVHVRQRRQLDRRRVAGRAVRPHRRGAGRCRPATSSTTRRSLTALGNDVGFDLVFSRQLIAHGAAGDIAVGLSTSGNSRNVLTAFAEAPGAGLLTIGLAGYDGGEMAALSRTCSTAWSSTPTASTGCRRPRPRWASPCGRRCRPALGGSTMTEAGDREAEVLDRIEAFRRRRPAPHRRGRHAGPRRRRQGIGGADRRGVRRGVRRRRRPRPLADAATLALPTGERFAFTTDSFVVQPRRFPGGSIGHLAVHGTVNDLAVPGRPADVAVGRLRDRGGLPGRRAPSRRRRHGRGRGDGRRRASSPATPRWSARARPTGCTSRPPASASCRPGATLGPEHVEPGDVVLVSGTIADHGMAVMLARGDLALDADIRSDTAPLGELVDALLEAAPSTRWLRDPTRGGVGTVCNELARDSNLAVVLDETAAAGRPGGHRRLRPAGDRSALRRQRGQGASPWCRADEADAALAALRSHPLGATGHAGSARSRPTRRASSCCSRPSAGHGSSTCSSATRCPGSADGG